MTVQHNSLRSSVINLIALFIALCSGCAQPIDPALPATISQGRDILHDMEHHPEPLPRPMVIIGGMFDPGFATCYLGSQFRDLSEHSTIVTVDLAWHLSFWGYRKEILDRIDKALPPDKNGVRPAADVIGYSLGGLVARYAAIAENDGRAPLHIARLFTISTPHRGASLAQNLPLVLQAQGDLRLHSSRILEINNAPHDYPIDCYGRLGDYTVGIENTAPPGQGVWWVYTPWFNFPHFGAPTDPRIVADIALRIRGLSPLSTFPPSPIPQ